MQQQPKLTQPCLSFKAAAAPSNGVAQAMKAPKVNNGLPKLKTGDTPMLPHLIETSEIRKQMSGIVGPCGTELTPNLPQAPAIDVNKPV